jgi:acyl carrier protein
MGDGSYELMQQRSLRENTMHQQASDNSVMDRISGIVHDLMRRRQLALPLTVDQSLREAGLKSLDLVNMMLAIEDEFSIELPQEQLTLDNFQSIGAIERLVAEIVR